jgi:hypothetical protein
MITKWITSALAFFARRSSNVKVQATLATLYGLVAIFGVGPSFAIILKLKKQTEQENAKHARKNGSGMSRVRSENNNL